MARQPGGDFGNRSVGSKRVEAVQAVKVAVHEAGNDKVAAHVDRVFVTGTAAPGRDLDNAAILDDDGAFVFDAAGKDEGAAPEDQPARSPDTIRIKFA